MSSALRALSLEVNEDMPRLAMHVDEGRPEVELSDSAMRVLLQRSAAEGVKHVVLPIPTEAQPLDLEKAKSSLAGKLSELLIDWPFKNPTDMGCMEAETSASESEIDSKGASDSGTENRVGEPFDVTDEFAKKSSGEEDAVVTIQHMPSALQDFMGSEIGKRNTQATMLVPSSLATSSACAVDRKEERTEQNAELEWTNNEVLTLMMRNIPCSCTRNDILAAIEEVGFDQMCDFFYVPVRRDKCLGYAFINFPFPELAREFARAITGYRFKHSRSDKQVTVSPAATQGLRENMRHFKTTAVMHTKSKPFFKRRQAFDLQPEPTADREHVSFDSDQPFTHPFFKGRQAFDLQPEPMADRKHVSFDSCQPFTHIYPPPGL